MTGGALVRSSDKAVKYNRAAQAAPHVPLSSQPRRSPAAKFTPARTIPPATQGTLKKGKLMVMTLVLNCKLS